MSKSKGHDTEEQDAEVIQRTASPHSITIGPCVSQLHPLAAKFIYGALQRCTCMPDLNVLSQFVLEIEGVPKVGPRL